MNMGANYGKIFYLEMIVVLGEIGGYNAPCKKFRALKVRNIPPSGLFSSSPTSAKGVAP
jgi:hypothetical protein